VITFAGTILPKEEKPWFNALSFGVGLAISGVAIVTATGFRHLSRLTVAVAFFTWRTRIKRRAAAVAEQEETVPILSAGETSSA
jgi:hypothetical protein